MKGSSEAVLTKESDGYVSSHGTWLAWPPCVRNVVCICPFMSWVQPTRPGQSKSNKTLRAPQGGEVFILQCPWAPCGSAAHMFSQSQDVRGEPEGSLTSKVGSGPSVRKLSCPVFSTGALCGCYSGVLLVAPTVTFYREKD